MTIKGNHATVKRVLRLRSAPGARETRKVTPDVQSDHKAQD